MANFNFDSSTVEIEKPRSYGPLPAGDYECIVVRSDLKQTKAGTGEYLELEIHVISGDHTGRRLWERLNVNNENKTAEEIARKALAQLMNAVGIGSLQDTEQLHDRPFTAQVQIDRKDPERNRIMSYSMTGNGQPKPAAAPAAAPAKPAASRPWG